jgi:hypothetical protein
MPFTRYADSDQMQILTAALEKHCQEFGIEDGEEHDSLAKLVMTFYHGGISSIEGLTKALAATRVRARPSVQ